MACDINKVIIQTNNIFEKMFGNALELVECFKNKFEFETTIISQRLLCYNPQNEKLSNYNNKKNPKYNESITKLCDTIQKLKVILMIHIFYIAKELFMVILIITMKQ